MEGQSIQPIIPDHDYRHAYMAAIIAMTVIAVLLAWLRIYTRMYISRNVWWDDWVMLIATVSPDESGMLPRPGNGTTLADRWSALCACSSSPSAPTPFCARLTT